MPAQLLDHYRVPADWARGSYFARITWFLFGKPLCASLIPGTIWRRFLLQLFGAKIGRGTRIKPRLHVTSPWMLRIGNYCWLGEDLWIDNLINVLIGDHVCLSQGAYLCTGNHNYRIPSFDLRLGAIEIQSHAWIAAKSVLAPGVTVGTGAIVSLGSVVLTDVHPNSIVRGNPAQCVGQR